MCVVKTVWNIAACGPLQRLILQERGDIRYIVLKFTSITFDNRVEACLREESYNWITADNFADTSNGSHYFRPPEFNEARL